MTTNIRSLPCALLLTALAVAVPASADTITWSNPAGGDWDVPANWSPPQVPGESDRAVVNGTASFTIQVTGGQFASELVMDNPNATLRVVGTTGASATLTVAGGFENRGTIELTSEDAGSWAWLNLTTAPLTNAAGATLRVLQGAGGPRYLHAELDNRGTLEIGRDLDLQAAGGNHRNSGVVSLAAGTRLNVTAGDWTHQPGGSITGTGTINFNSTLILEADFTVGGFGVEGSLTVNGPGRFVLPAGPVFTLRSGWTFNADIDNDRDLLVEGGVTINGAFGVPAGRTLRIVGTTGASATLTVAGGFENRGTIELTSEDAGSWAWLNLTTAPLTNAVGAVLRVFPGAGGPRYLHAELDNRGTLEIGRDLDLQAAGGNHRNSGVVSLAAGTRLNVTAGDWTHQPGGSITGTGTINFNSTLILETDFTVGGFGVEGSLTVNGPGRFVLPPGPVFTLRSGWTFNADIDNDRDLLVDGGVTINGAFGVPTGRTLRIVGITSSSATLTVANGFENRGTIELTSEDAGSWAWLNLTTAPLTNAAGATLRVLQGAGGPRYLYAELDNRGTVEVGRDLDLHASGVNHRNSGVIEVTAGTLAMSGDSFENTGEVRVLAGATFAFAGPTLTNAVSGLFSGTGTFDFSGATTVANGGTVAPGASPGTLSVTGNYPQAAGGRLNMEIGGFTPGSGHDRLAISGQAQPGGAIRAILVNGFSPKKDAAFTVLTYASRSGSFAIVQSAEPERIVWRMQYNATSAQLIVANTAPTIASIANQTVNEETLLSLTATATDQDLPPQAFTYSLDAAPSGMTINSSSGLINWTPTEAQGPGVHNVTVRVTDNGTPVLAHTTSFSVTVNEVNVAPQLVLPASQTVNEQVQLAFTVNATDADLPANALTYEMLSGPAGATFNPTTREFRWTPTEAQGPGSFTASFRVTDNNPAAVNTQQLSATGDVSITVNEVNVAPVLATIGNQTVSEQALLSVTATATDSDLPANALTYSLDTAPAGMTIHPSSGAITWTPTESQGPGVYNVSVRATDNGTPSLSHTTSFSVTVNEANLAPTLATVPDSTIPAGNAFTASLSATDPDLPANGLTYSLVNGPAGATVSPGGVVNWSVPLAAAGTVANFSVRVTDNGTPALADTKGFAVTITEPVFTPVLVLPGPQTVDEQTELVFTITATHPVQPVSALTFELVTGPAGATFNPATREFRWTPTEAQGPGVFTATFQVTENVEQLSATGDVSITVNDVNLAPTLAPIANQSVDEQTLLSLGATATDSDVPANALTYSLDTAPSGMSINAVSGLITWTPTEAQGPGVHNVTVRVTDNGTPALDHTTSFSVVVTEINLAPALTPLGNKTIDEQTLLSLSATATDSDSPVNALTYSLDTAPTGMTIDPASGLITWTPTEEQGPGVHNVTVRVTDNGSPALTDAVSFTVTVNEINLAPQLAVPGTQVVYEQNELVFTINATDADRPANVLTYEMVSGPVGATFNPSTREFRWTPTSAQAPGYLSATFRVTDNNPDAINTQQLSANGEVSITVVQWPLLEYRFASETNLYELPLPGGCPLARFSSFPLPSGNWANGQLTIEILGNEEDEDDYDGLGLKPAPLDHGSDRDVIFLSAGEGTWTVTSQQTTFGTLRFAPNTDNLITVDLNPDATSELIVDLLRGLEYFNRIMTPWWFRSASDRFPRRTISITLTDELQTRVQRIVRDVQFPYLTETKVGRAFFPDGEENPPSFEYFSGTSVVVKELGSEDVNLHVGGEFSNGQLRRVPLLNTEWRSDCSLFGTSFTGINNLTDRVLSGGIQPIFYPNPECCLVRAQSGSLWIIVEIYFSRSECLFNIFACNPNYVFPAAAAAAHLNQDQGNPTPAISLPAFHALEALMKRTPDGQRLVDLYWQHTAEVLRLLLANPQLRDQVAGVLATFQPGVAALLAGDGQSAPITQSMIDDLNILWSALIEKASPALKTVLEEERARFNNFQQFVNKDFSQWAGLLEIPAPTQPWLFISSATREGGRVTVECNDVPGASLTLWRSYNLSSWEQVLNAEVSRSTHTIRFSDPAPPPGSVFYQVRR